MRFAPPSLSSTAFRPTPAIPAVSLLLIALLANFIFFRTQALATSFRIETPENGAVIQNGNIALVEVAATESQPGQVRSVEISLDSEMWQPAERSSLDADNWRLFVDVAPGRHEIHARAFDASGAPSMSANAWVEAQDAWTLPFSIATP